MRRRTTAKRKKEEMADLRPASPDAEDEDVGAQGDDDDDADFEPPKAFKKRKTLTSSSSDLTILKYLKASAHFSFFIF
jgi:hypothetical protein